MDGTDDEAVLKLSEGQRECLRLVMAGYKSKEIAYQLGITMDAVNKRLAAAMATLGAPSRAIAARRLAAFENQVPYHSLVSQTLAVAPEPDPIDVGPHTDTEDVDHEQRISIERLEEPQAPYVVHAEHGRPSPAPPIHHRLVATPSRTFAVMLAVGVAVALLTRL